MALVDDVGQEFDYQRKKAAQREGANLQSQRDALVRRQAQLGGGPSGAFVKAEQNAADASAQRLNDVNEGIDTAQRGEMRRLREVQEGRDFTRSEREAGQAFIHGERIGTQDWQSEQADAQRRWATGEREAGQVYATGEREAGQRFVHDERVGSEGFAKSEREASQGWQSGEAAAARQWQSDENALGRLLQSSQFRQQIQLEIDRFEHDKYVDDFNMDMSEKIYADKDLFDRLLNPSGGANVPGGTLGAIADTATGGIYGRVASKLPKGW